MSELKIIAIQVILMAILGAFMLLYSQSSTPQANIPGTATNQSIEVSSSSQSWITSLISIPSGMGDLFFISLLVISPFLIFDGIIALRFAKDIVTNWL